jgi:DnaD and phage-associated domain
MEELLNYQCIDFRKLLVIKAKELKLNDYQCYVLLLIMTMDDINIKPITPSSIKQFCSLPLSKIDETLISLVDQHILSRQRGSLNLTPLYHLLLNQKEKEIAKDIDLISVFENSFGRSLNQMELGIIQGFKTSGYDDRMILEALNEAVKSGVMNFRYIEKILDNWSKQGVRRRFALETPQKKVEVDQHVKDYQWWDEDE